MTIAKQYDIRHPKLQLMDHQSMPVRHLLDRCISQKGLLIWHAMGTGKSATGLSFIASLRHTKAFLLTPSNLSDVWISEGQKFGIDIKNLIRQNKVSMHNFDSYHLLKKKLLTIRAEDFVFVVDEAQHLVSMLKTLSPKEAHQLVSIFQKFKKVILMTGTPMYNDENDFRILVNIAAGKLILPVRLEEFKKVYYKTSLWRSVFIGWFLTFFSKFLYQSRDFVGVGLNLDMVLRGTQSTSKQIYSALINVVQKILYNFEVSAIVAVSIPFVIPIIILTLIRIALSSQIDKIRLLDADKVAHAVKSYVSFFDVPDASRGIDYPKINVKREKINYNAGQIDLWLRFSMGQLDSKETVALNISENTGEADFFGDITTIDQYKFYGRAIGNLELNEPVCPKFKAIENIMMSANNSFHQTVIYSNFERQGAKLFANYLKKREIPFEYLSTKLTLTSKKRMLNAFADRKFPVLILHPSFIEGISICGARQMHILEPIENQAVLEQIIARVARYRSHYMYPPLERSVDVHIWSCVATSFYSRLLKFSASKSLWARYQPWMGPWAEMSKFGYDVTPDALITARGALFAENLKRLTNSLTAHNVLSLDISAENPTCKITPDPDNEFLKECDRFG